MTLTLEVTEPHAEPRAVANRRVFSESGGIIGREKNCDLVLPHAKVSGSHARITCSSGVFYIEDTSRNGVFLNSHKNRLERGRPYALKSGDRIYIDPYIVDVFVTAEEAFPSVSDGSRDPDYGSSNPFQDDDPFVPRRSPLPTPSDRSPKKPVEVVPGQEVDPLKLISDRTPKPPSFSNAPNASDLERGSHLRGHYQPPAVPPSPSATPLPTTPPPNVPLIPADYDPMRDDSFDIEPALPPRAAPPPATPPPTPREEPPTPPPVPVEMDPPQVKIPVPAAPVLPPAVAPPSVRDEPTPRPPKPVPPAAPGDLRESDLAAVLAGAGLENIPVTSELARNFGQILRIVVSGVMDVLRARQQIKDEFRMRMTQFRPADNNPLKFSANVDDALHNLLVKRNAAYLEPVEAFDDAFDDLRDHQIAMLAGMRVAFESMLARFHPDKMEQDFERQLKRGAFLGVTAKLRYWDLYRDKQQEMAKDPDASFRKLFGEEFAKAYEEQLARLKAERRAEGSAKPPRRPEE
jgi:type VI secretion system FHA domain protein